MDLDHDGAVRPVEGTALNPNVAIVNELLTLDGVGDELADVVQVTLAAVGRVGTDPHRYRASQGIRRATLAF